MWSVSSGHHSLGPAGEDDVFITMMIKTSAYTASNKTDASICILHFMQMDPDIF